MNNVATGLTVGAMVTAIVTGSVTLYSYKRGITCKDVLDKLEIEKNTFSNIVQNIIELGKELIEKLYNIIVRLVEQVIFKVKSTFKDRGVI